MRYIVREIYYLIIAVFQKVRNRSLSIQFRAKTTLHSKFEGYNKLSHHSFFSGEMGYGSYIGAYSIVGGKIGRYCSIAEKVSFLSKTHPVKDFVSSHPCFYSLKKQNGFTYVNEQLFDEEPKIDGSDYSIIVGNDVYIGYGATIIGPCRIGDGAVIAAGAVITEDVPDYAIVGGVPARVIKNRFSDEDIDYLKKLRWWDKTQDWLMKNAQEFTSVERIKKALSESK